MVLVIRLLIDDVPFDVELQIKRNDFLNSKIIDHVADEADAVVLADATHCDIAVHQKDTMEEYLTFDELFNNDDEDEVTDGDDGESEVLGPGARSSTPPRTWGPKFTFHIHYKSSRPDRTAPLVDLGRAAGPAEVRG